MLETKIRFTVWGQKKENVPLPFILNKNRNNVHRITAQDCVYTATLKCLLVEVKNLHGAYTTAIADNRTALRLVPV